jgi:hypothetical protein
MITGRELEAEHTVEAANGATRRSSVGCARYAPGQDLCEHTSAGHGHIVQRPPEPLLLHGRPALLTPRRRRTPALAKATGASSDAVKRPGGVRAASTAADRLARRVREMSERLDRMAQPRPSAEQDFVYLAHAAETGAGSAAAGEPASRCRGAGYAAVLGSAAIRAPAVTAGGGAAG